MKPDDKPKPNDSTYEEPKLYKTIEDDEFPMPALETAFVDFSHISEKSTEELTGCSCNMVGTAVCSCNKVKAVCSCVGYTKCSCTSHTSGKSQRRVTGCRCAPVH
jgi:hypothetical protein